MAGYEPEAQTIFDGLWEFSRQQPSDIDPRLMGWQYPVVPGSNASAFDGDADIAYGLLLAEAQWVTQVRIDYGAEAATVIAGILAATIGPDSRLPTLGDWVEPNGNPYNQYTPRSSDFMPSHFRAYGRATNDATWETVVSESQTVIDSLQLTASPTTGLLPDFIVGADGTPQPAPPGFLEGPHDGHYHYNAGRDPWRIGLDVLLNGDATSRAQVQKMSHWLESATGGDPTQIKAGYHLDGSLTGNYFTSFFVAPFGVAAMSDPAQQSWLNAIYTAVYNRHEDYYEDSVTMLSLLAMSGNFWDPTVIGGPGPASYWVYLPVLLKS
jgi:endo-1,4-beta-D-glucanase Y